MSKIKHFVNRMFAKYILNVGCILYDYSKKSKFGTLGLFLFKHIIKSIDLSCYGIVSHEVYTKINTNSQIIVLKKNRKGYSSNLIYDENEFCGNFIEYPLPNIYTFQHNNVRIQGDSDFIIDIESNFIINDFCYNMNPRYQFFDGVLLNLKSNFAILKYDGCCVDKHISSGIMISGKFSCNYYHQMYENLIRLLLLKDIDIPSNVPIIVDEVVFKVKSFKKIFETLTEGINRDVVVIGNKEIIEFDRLYCFSALNYLSPHIKNLKFGSSNDYIFDLELISEMRNKLLSVKSKNNFPSKIYLTRKHTNKRHFNEDEIFEKIQKFGFEKIAPEEYSFEEQVAIFNGADFIVGGSGGAFTNLLFCHKDCKVICFRARRTNNPIFTTIAYLNGVKMRYCASNSNNTINTHMNYLVDIKMFKKIFYLQLNDGYNCTNN